MSAASAAGSPAGSAANASHTVYIIPRDRLVAAAAGGTLTLATPSGTHHLTLDNQNLLDEDDGDVVLDEDDLDEDIDDLDNDLEAHEEILETEEVIHTHHQEVLEVEEEDGCLENPPD